MQKSWRPFLVVALKTQAELLNEPLRLSKNAPPPCNCLQVLVLHTAAVTKTLEARLRLGEGAIAHALT